jgi:hypothetical protein
VAPVGSAHELVAIKKRFGWTAMEKAYLNEACFTPITLWRFEARLKQNHPHLLFTTALQQLDEGFPEERTSPQIGDTFALLSRAHEQSRTQLLRTICQRLLDTLQQETPAQHQPVEASLPHDAFFGAGGEKPEWVLDKPARDGVEERTAAAAYHLLRLLQAVHLTLPGSRDLLYLALTRGLPSCARF